MAAWSPRTADTATRSTTSCQERRQARRSLSSGTGKATPSRGGLAWQTSWTSTGTKPNGTLWPRTWRKASGPGQGHILVPGVREGERFGRAHRWRLPMAKRPCPLRLRAWRPPPGERYPPHPEQAGRSLPGAGRAGLMEDGDAGLLRGKTLTGVAAVLHARRHRPCHSQGAGQHDPPVHRLARQPRPRRPAPPIVNRANVA